MKLSHKVTQAELGVLLSKNGKSYPITSWPAGHAVQKPDQKWRVWNIRLCRLKIFGTNYKKDLLIIV